VADFFQQQRVSIVSVSEWVAIQKNPTSGSGQRALELKKLEEELQRQGLRVKGWTDREAMQRELADPVNREGLRCVVAAGGEGTVADVLNRYPDVPLAILPLGTENLVARLHGVTHCGTKLAEMITANHRITLDLGLTGERRFLLMTSIGFDAEVIHRMTASRRGNISKLAYVSPIFHTVRSYGYPEINL